MENVDKQAAAEEKDSFLQFFLMSVKPVIKTHLGVVIGTLAGMILAVCILLFGFWNMIFVVILAAIGAYAGYKIDRKEDILPSLPVLSLLAEQIKDKSWGIARDRKYKKKRLQ